MHVGRRAVRLVPVLGLASLFTSTPTRAATVETFAEMPARFEDISVGPNENLFLPSHPAGDLVFRLDLDGTLTEIGSGFQFPLGGAVAANGDYYVSCFNANHIHRIAADGTISVFATGIVTPTGLVFTPDEQTLYAASYNLGQLIRIDTVSGDRTVVADGSTIVAPDGIALDEAGNVYVASFLTPTITKVDPAGNESVLVTLPGTKTGYIDYRSGFLYVAGLDTHQIYRVSTVDGTYTTLAGTGVPGTTDGPAESALIDSPNGLALSKDGRTLWFQSQNLVRRVLLGDPADVKEGAAQPWSGRVSLVPNPFREKTRVELSSVTGSAVVSICDAAGRLLRTLSGSSATGDVVLEWDGADAMGRSVADGVYYVRVATADGSADSRVVRLR
ncbi:MAG: SMP-30/gluconolactonase/LRE family protein [Candidatus Eisenbacteria bacterium]